MPLIFCKPQEELMKTEVETASISRGLNKVRKFWFYDLPNTFVAVNLHFLLPFSFSFEDLCISSKFRVGFTLAEIRIIIWTFLAGLKIQIKFLHVFVGTFVRSSCVLKYHIIAMTLSAKIASWSLILLCRKRRATWF